MDHSNDNSAHHHQPEAAAGGAENSNSSGNNVDDSSNVRRLWLWCPGCDTVHAHDQNLQGAFYQTLPLGCSNCRRYNHQQWGVLIIDENLNNDSSNFTDDDDSDDEEWDHQLTEEIIWAYLFLRDYCRKSEEKEESEICVVCQNEFKEEEVSKRLDCGHHYHYQCIRQWLLHKNSCPLCLCTVIPPNFASDPH